MAESAAVYSIQALADLRAALLRFGAEARSALDTTGREIQTTRGWLEERRRHWLGEVRRREEMVARARAAYQQCLAAAERSGGGCRQLGEAFVKTQLYLEEANAALKDVLGWTHLVERAAADYERQAGRLAGLLGTNVPNSTALLQRSVERLEAYVATAPPPAATPSTVGALDQIGLAAIALLGIPAPDPPTGGSGIETSGNPEIKESGGPERRG